MRRFAGPFGQALIGVECEGGGGVKIVTYDPPHLCRRCERRRDLSSDTERQMQQAKRRLHKLHWIKQIIPRTLYSLYYTEDGSREFCIWRQWLGRSYDIRRFSVPAPE